jgi:hypothetical protein
MFQNKSSAPLLEVAAMYLVSPQIIQYAYTSRVEREYEVGTGLFAYTTMGLLLVLIPTNW